MNLAQDDRGPQLFRQSGEFLIEDRGEVGRVGRPRFGSVHGCVLFLAAAVDGPAGVQSGPAGDAVEPVPYHAGRLNRRRPPRENQERGLEHVFGIVGVPRIRWATPRTSGPCRFDGEPRRPFRLGA